MWAIDRHHLQPLCLCFEKGLERRFRVHFRYIRQPLRCDVPLLRGYNLQRVVCDLYQVGHAYHFSTAFGQNSGGQIMRWQRIRALIQSHRVQHYIRWFSHLIERKALTPISVNALSAPHATELITDNILTENHIHIGAVQYTHLS